MSVTHVSPPLCPHLLHREGEVPRCTLALSDEEGPVVPLFVEHLLCFGSGDLPKEPPGGENESVSLTAATRAYLSSLPVSINPADWVRKHKRGHMRSRNPPHRHHTSTLAGRCEVTRQRC